MRQGHLSEPTVEIVNITPDMARSWLGGHNRALRPTVWGRYARDMLSGAWEFNGESIKRTADGVVIDGQHRLMAIAETGLTVKALVVTGLAASAQDTVDHNLPRNIADVLRLHGETNVNLLAAAIAQAIVLRSPNPTTTAAYWPSAKEALHFLDEHPSIRASILVGGRAQDALRTPASTAATFDFLFHQLDEDDAEAFMDGLISGAELASDSPILRLREFMVREVLAQRRSSRTRLSAYYAKSWNTWRAGKPMAQLKWRVGGASPEKFPIPE